MYNRDKIRRIESGYTQWFDDDNTEDTPKIIEHPEKYLLCQEGIFEAEGGYLGLISQAAFITAGVCTLGWYKKNLFRSFCNGNMCKDAWIYLGLTAFVGHEFGYRFGVDAFGNDRALTNHWIAYHH